MAPTGSLDAYRTQVYSCTMCAACLPVCPTYKATGEESLSARGRVSLMEAVLDGELGLTHGFAERLSKCLVCGACAAACPSGVDVPAAVLAARAELARAGNRRLTRAATRRLISKKTHTGKQRLWGACESAYRHLPGFRFLPWFEDGRRRSLPKPGSRPLEELLPEVSRVDGATLSVALFPGCATSMIYQQTALAAVRVLNRAGAEVVLPRGLGCCGLPFRSLGDMEMANALMENCLRTLGTHKVDAVVTVCSSCALALKAGAEKTPGSVPVLDIHELLAEIGVPAARPDQASRSMTQGTRQGRSQGIVQGRSQGMVRDRIRDRVTWHDPCHLGRDLGVIAEPREIIAGLPGVEYVEAGELSCCGGGGLFSLLHYDLALKIGRSRARELTATGASLIATGCPGCRMQLEDMLARLGSTARVVHTVELLDGVVPAAAPRISNRSLGK